MARELLISTSKLSRLENAQGKPRPRDIRDLIRYYGIEGTPEAARLSRWVTERADARDGGPTLTTTSSSSSTRIWPTRPMRPSPGSTPCPFLPALLQTDEYAEAVYRDMEQRSPEQISQLMEIRQTRREALVSREGLDPLQLVAVTHESTLHQMVGSPRMMRDQMNAILERLDQPDGQRPDNIRLHVLPFSALPVRTMTCMYAYFEYQDPEDLEQDVVNIETQAGWWSIEDPGQVSQYRKWHDALVSTALNQDDSLALIRSVRNGE